MIGGVGRRESGRVTRLLARKREKRDRAGRFPATALQQKRHKDTDNLVPRTFTQARVKVLGPVSRRPGNLTGPESDFDIKVSRKVGRVVTSDEVHFVSLADNLTVQFSNLLKLPLEWKTKQLNGPGNYRELRETGLWDRSQGKGPGNEVEILKPKRTGNQRCEKGKVESSGSVPLPS